MKVPQQVRLAGSAFLGVFYPNFCQICAIDLNISEQHVCLSCSYDLPYIEQNKNALHKLEKRFWGRVKVENVFSLLNYQRGNQTQLLLHELKYKNKTKLGSYLGNLLGAVIPADESLDLILPVPLHPKKQRKRGFNQSTIIANGIAQHVQAPVVENYLVRNAFNQSQTKFSKYDRWENVRQIFSVKNPTRLEGKHVLLVDDVLTTGATIEACVRELLMIKNCTVSIATLAARI